MLTKFNEIRICLDLITVEKKVYIILYSYFSGDILAIWKYDTVEDEELKDRIKKYTDSKYNITTILTIRPHFRFYSIIKENAPSSIKMMSYSKF